MEWIWSELSRKCDGKWHSLRLTFIFLRLLAQTQPDRFQPDWNHLDWNDPDDTDTDDPKDDPGGPGSKPRSLSTPNIPVHILSAPIDCPKITSSQTLRKLQFKDVNFWRKLNVAGRNGGEMYFHSFIFFACAGYGAFSRIEPIDSPSKQNNDVLPIWTPRKYYVFD